jgi:hypothetical protein
LAATDAIKIVENTNTVMMVGSTKISSSSIKNFITEQLGVTQLSASEWTFTRYTRLNTICLYNPYGCCPQPPYCEGYPGSTSGGAQSFTYYGEPTYNTRIEGILYAVPYINIGLRIYDGATTTSIAAEPLGALTSPLRIFKNGNIYGIVLVSTTDAMASKIRIMTSSGVKALRKY